MAFSNYLIATIDSAKIDAALSNFPVLLYLSASSGISSFDLTAIFDEVGANSKKIKVTTDVAGAVECYVEIEKWDNGSQEAWLWVKVPSVSNVADTPLYFWYDNGESDNNTYIGVTGSGPGETVWDANFLGVYHFGQDPSSVDMTDSTDNDNDLTPTNFSGGESEDALHGVGVHFDGSTQYMAGDVGALNAPFTVEITVYFDQATQTDYDYVFEFNTDAFTHARKLTNNLYYNYAGEYLNGAAITGQQWVHLAGLSKVNAVFISSRKDGAADVLDGDTGAKVDVGGAFSVGRYSGDNHYFDGVYCELRISNIERVAAWTDASNDTARDSLVTWTDLSPVNTEAADLGDAVAVNISYGVVETTEAAGMGDEVENNFETITEAAALGDAAKSSPIKVELTEAVDLGDAMLVGIDTAPLSEDAELTDVHEVALAPYPLVEASDMDDEVIGQKSYEKSITETLSLWETLGWAWGKVIADTFAITDAVTPAVAVPISEWLTISDTLATNWTGTETISESLYIFGQNVIQQIFNDTISETVDILDTATPLGVLISSIADSLAIVDATSNLAHYNPAIIEAVAVAGVTAVLTNFNNGIAEAVDFADTAQPGWDKTISESMAIADSPSVLFLAMNMLTESIAFTESVLQQFQIDDSIAEILTFASTLAIQQTLQASITDTIDFGITVELDNEVWETWVVNTNRFNISIYSGYEFNSYAVYNGVAYGCKADGIFKLSGTTDDESAFVSGIVLPQDNFGTTRKKRFRAAYFGLSGGVTPSLRVETDSGSTTYTIVNAKANITRDRYGKRWILKVQDFDDLDFIELIPIVLARR